MSLNCDVIILVNRYSSDSSELEQAELPGKGIERKDEEKARECVQVGDRLDQVPEGHRDLVAVLVFSVTVYAVCYRHVSMSCAVAAFFNTAADQSLEVLLVLHLPFD
ncbi:hypothetical protein GIB67_027917 [Kingdonia uniflora]|uniref:Uncharacterized protein n=1 Tax=Kingdonia uniflora TaxID=39325 RepID=A0A7J7LGS0_9MAGN|nr:hypothetical protein GIB67_027917 [Kingdonia uniflora]